jgi:2-oxo-4-hydroxy-4-carboxy-5-ureidoimidazoline decarboxylase
VSEMLAHWNKLPQEEAAREILPCCGSRTWAASMASKRPIREEAVLLAVADEIWRGLSKADWLDAFQSHPRIGESSAEKNAESKMSAWSEQEQQKAATANDAVKIALKQDNREYEKKFGRFFIVCATGKSASEILEILQRRLHNDEATELHQAAEEQRQIMNIRLKKWLAG